MPGLTACRGAHGQIRRPPDGGRAGDRGGARGGLRRALAAHAGAALAPARPDPRARAWTPCCRPARRSAWTWPRSSRRSAPFGAATPRPTLLVPAAQVEHVTRDGRGARARSLHSVWRGSTRAGSRIRHLAARRSPRRGTEPHDMAVTPRAQPSGTGRWRPACNSGRCVRPPRARSPTCSRAARPELDGELAAEPARWWPEVGIGALASRSLRDRRGRGRSRAVPAICSPAVSRCCSLWRRSSGAGRSLGGASWRARGRTAGGHLVACARYRPLRGGRLRTPAGAGPPAGGGRPRRAQSGRWRGVGPPGLGRPGVATSPWPTGARSSTPAGARRGLASAVHAAAMSRGAAASRAAGRGRLRPETARCVGGWLGCSRSSAWSRRS